MKSIALVLILAVATVYGEFYVTTTYSDSACQTMVGRRATSFFQNGDCSSELMFPDCTATTMGDYVMDACLEDPVWTPEPTWSMVVLYTETYCTTAYAYYMAEPDRCTGYMYSNTFTLTSCEASTSSFSEGTTDCDYFYDPVDMLVPGECKAAPGMGVKFYCPGGYVPAAPVSTPTAAPTSAAPTSAPSAAPTTSNTPAKKSDAASAVAGSALLLMSAALTL